MEDWKLPPELQRIEQELTNRPLPGPPPELRQKVLKDPRAIEYFANCAQQSSSAPRPLVDILSTAVDAPASLPPVSTGLPSIVRSNYGSNVPKYYSYLKSGVIVLFATMVAWYFSTMNYPRVGQSALTATGVGGTVESLPTFVGRVTGAVDCVWAEGALLPPSVDYVTIGQQINLKSGLLEITYNNGTKIVLLGPVVYAIGSDGGYLAAGTLVAKLEKSRANAQPTVHDGKKSVLDAFAAGGSTSPTLLIGTPSVGVFNVGKEIGVKVDEKDKSTLIHVFQGSAALCSPLDTGQRPWHVLEESESVRLDVPAAGQEPAMQSVVVAPSEFVYQVGGHL